MNLQALLHSTFGFPAFRANQEAVCRAATEGSDVLLVMPTGAGKSLCYQLPAIARGGTALVISPLIALMDDQAAKLTALGLRVARIHSGLPREDARQACRDYLDGQLNFLFIAPERMRVPGFPEMLARRKPSLIAIDEAHCISAWGHDFRPDYRTLGENLPALRPAPIIALTATATPTVQKDIVAQLQLRNPALFIHGFRRANLAIEVVEMSKPRRHEFAASLLKERASRPAIVYAPSRKACEELAAELGRHFPTAAYHAGLAPALRERVQSEFQSGSLEVVVATIAFGMGIDKADVRTVIHTALPSSVEAFYQEIGRAGRDGLPSRTVLLHNFADRKMHEFFLDRDYPPASDLARVAQVLSAEHDQGSFLMPEPLAQRLKMDLGSFSKAIEKLVAQGAVTTDLAGNVRRTPSSSAGDPDSWRAGYDAQIAFRRAQIDRMIAFSETQQCRMLALIRHFGDTADAHLPCGQCDVCAPVSATAQTFVPPSAEDLRQLAAILRALGSGSRSTGKLHTEVAGSALKGTASAKDRKIFDGLLESLSRAALVSLTAETFTNPEGNVIPYRKAALTHEGREAAFSGKLDQYGLLIRSADVSEAAASPAGRRKTAARSSKASLKAEREQNTAAYTPAQRELEERLRAWRKAEAGKTGKPSFIVFGDAVLRALVLAQPTTLSELLRVPGIGPEKSDRFGAEIVALCRFSGAGESGAADKFPQAAALTLAGHSALVSEGRDKAVSPALDVRSAAAQSLRRPGSIAPEAEVDLTADQLELEARLRAWRKSEAEKRGLPQFFVLSASTLRSLVLLRPRTLSRLQDVPGIGPEKVERFGTSLVDLCTG